MPFDEPEFLKPGTDGRIVPDQDAGEDEQAVLAQPVCDALSLCHEDIVEDIGADEMKLASGVQGQACEVCLGELDAVRNAVGSGILVGVLHGGRIKIKGLDRLIAQLGGSDGEDPRTGAHIEKGGWGFLSGGTLIHQCLKAV